jgi:hypothetical protein
MAVASSDKVSILNKADAREGSKESAIGKKRTTNINVLLNDHLIEINEELKAAFDLRYSSRAVTAILYKYLYVNRINSLSPTCL